MTLRRFKEWLENLPPSKSEWVVPILGVVLGSPLILAGSALEKGGYPPLLFYSVGFVGISISSFFIATFLKRRPDGQ